MAAAPELNPNARLAAPVEAADTVPEILYIMGTGRSGTTILEILLTNEDGITASGELKHIFRDAYVRDLPCACGKPGRQCELWSSVLQESAWSPEECRRIGSSIASVESHGHFPLVYAGVANRQKLALYRDATTKLLTSVRNRQGSRVIVDSSKYPARALLLARMYPSKVKVLCITRSAAGLLAAFQKKNPDEQHPKSRLAAAAYYLYVLLCMRLVRNRLEGRCLTIRFEDLSRNPIATLEAIEHWSGLSLDRAKAKLANADWFEIGHIVTGNRLRKKGRVRFEPSANGPGARASRLTLLESLLERYRVLLGF